MSDRKKKEYFHIADYFKINFSHYKTKGDLGKIFVFSQNEFNYDINFSHALKMFKSHGNYLLHVLIKIVMISTNCDLFILKYLLTR